MRGRVYKPDGFVDKDVVPFPRSNIAHKDNDFHKEDAVR